MFTFFFQFIRSLGELTTLQSSPPPHHPTKKKMTLLNGGHEIYHFLSPCHINVRNPIWSRWILVCLKNKVVFEDLRGNLTPSLQDILFRNKKWLFINSFFICTNYDNYPRSYYLAICWLWVQIMHP